MFQLIWKICTFQARPEEVPYSIPLLLGKICVNLSVLVFIVTIATTSITAALWKAALFVTIIALYSLTLLTIYRFSERFVQLLSGLLASMAMILVVLAIPYVVVMFFLADTASNILYYTGLVFSLLLLLSASLWLYLVFARIYKHALEITINEGLMVSLILFMISAIVFALI